MKEYISLFETTAAYNAAKDSLDLPNVAYCKDLSLMHYNPNYADDYLTFVAKESGTFTFTTPTDINVIEYSTDNGTTWTEGNSVSVNSGDKVLWKGTMIPEELIGIGEFSSTGNFDAQGNVMSLLYGDNYKGQTDLTGKDWTFLRLFNDTKVINAKNLSLPATTLTDSCYGYMFYNCTSLTTAPELPATTLAQGCYTNMFRGCTSLTTAPVLPATVLANYCYNYMFRDCTSLNYIKAMFTTTPSDDYTMFWVKGVAATGTFVKSSAAQWNVSGDHGVPSGWTVETASE